MAVGHDHVARHEEAGAGAQAGLTALLRGRQDEDRGVLQHRHQVGGDSADDAEPSRRVGSGLEVSCLFGSSFGPALMSGGVDGFGSTAVPLVPGVPGVVPPGGTGDCGPLGVPPGGRLDAEPARVGNGADVAFQRPAQLGDLVLERLVALPLLLELLFQGLDGGRVGLLGHGRRRRGWRLDLDIDLDPVEEIPAQPQADQQQQDPAGDEADRLQGGIAFPVVIAALVARCSH